MRLSSRHETGEDASSVAWALSLFGFVPFAGLAVVLAIGGREGVWGALALDAIATYGAVILSFMGGVRWGAALVDRSDRNRRGDIVFSVLPSLIGWAALFMPAPVGLGVLCVAFAGQGAWDAFSAEGTDARLPRWFGSLRVTLTFLVVIALIVALVGIS